MENKNLSKVIMATRRSSMPPIDEYIDEIRQIWNSRWLSNEGRVHQRFQLELKEYLGVENLELYSNGHMSLELALSALDLKGEVITTPFTFISTPNAIVRNGLTPVFCDIRLGDFNIDVEKIEELITERTSAIVPVHIYGNPCDVEAIEKLAQKYNLKVVYDAAQAFGVKVNGRSIASYGDASIFSFHATKVFHTIEGGATIYSDSRKKDIFSGMSNFGIITEGEFEYLSPNAKMNEFQAAMGICNLKYVDEEISKRKKIYERYREGLKTVSGIHMVSEREGVVKNYTYMPLLIDPGEYGCEREKILENLLEANIFAAKFFSPLIVKMNYYNKRYSDENLPIASYVAKNIISLPMFVDIETEDVDKICEIIKNTKK